MLPNENGGILLTCIAATSGIGRMIFGKVADLPNVNRILLQQISFGNTGCRVFNGGVARFFLKINIPKGYCSILRIGVVGRCQKVPKFDFHSQK